MRARFVEWKCYIIKLEGNHAIRFHFNARDTNFLLRPRAHTHTIRILSYSNYSIGPSGLETLEGFSTTSEGEWKKNL